MPAHKNQHYVPKFYLRNFSADAKRLCSFLLSTKTGIQFAGIKEQCSKDYFYANDPNIEHTLSEYIEGPVQSVIDSILKTQQVPQKMSPDMAQLLTFIVTLHGRTAAAKRGIEEMVSNFGDQILKAKAIASGKFTAKQLERFRLKVNSPAMMALSFATLTVPLACDLDAVVLKSGTGDFITSDNPVILLNPYMAGLWEGSNTGWALSGLQVAVPLSPELMVFFYDSAVYELADHGRSLVLSTEDMLKLNQVQASNAEQTLYFRDWNKFPDVKALVSGIPTSRTAARSQAAMKKMTDEFGHELEVFHQRRVDPQLSGPLAFVRLRKDYEKIPSHERRPMSVRRPDFVAVHQEITRDILNTKGSPGELERRMNRMQGHRALTASIAHIL